MFGLNDNKSAGQDPDPVMPQPLESPEPDVSYGAHQDAGTAPTLDAGPPPAAPVPDYSSPVITDVPTDPAPGHPQSYSAVVGPPTPAPTPVLPAVADNSSDALLQMKQQALHSLAPLVGKLDQTPEEKFKTTMMMLQASDNPELVKSAYAAANQITDEKARAQALLDVVNEINYFTHHDAA